MVRWYESHQIGPDIGHIPVSNLYEVFVLFCWLTTLFYLYFEQHYRTRALGAFAMLVVSAAVGFLLWYTLVRQAHEIQPLVPALQSWWMKLRVPANFIGYGTFALAAMVALAFLLKTATPRSLWIGLVALPGALVVLPLAAFWAAGAPEAAGAAAKALRMVLPTLAFFAAAIALRPVLNPRDARRGGDGRRDVQGHRGRLRVLHHRHHPRRLLGRRGLGWLLGAGTRRRRGRPRRRRGWWRW